MVCKMATSCYGRISDSGNCVTFVISAVRPTSAHQTPMRKFGRFPSTVLCHKQTELGNGGQASNTRPAGEAASVGAVVASLFASRVSQAG